MLTNYQQLKHYELMPYFNFVSDITGYKHIRMDKFIVYEDTNFVYCHGMFYFYFYFNKSFSKAADRNETLKTFFNLHKNDIIQCCVNPYFFDNINIANKLGISTKVTIIFDIYNSVLTNGMKVSCVISSPEQLRDDEYVLFDRTLMLDELFQRYVAVESPKCNMPVLNKRVIEFINNYLC